MLQPLLSVTEMLWECSCRQPGRKIFVSPKTFGSSVSVHVCQAKLQILFEHSFYSEIQDFVHLLNSQELGRLLAAGSYLLTHDQHRKEVMDRIKLFCVCLGNGFAF